MELDRSQRPSASEPVFNVPPAVSVSLFVLIAFHVARAFMSPGFEEWWVLALAFIPSRYDGSPVDLPGDGWAPVTSFVTHALVHGDVLHLAFNGASLLAFGGAIAKRVGGLRYLALALVSAVAGALLFLFVNPGLLAPMIGASGAIAGLMGATLRFLFGALNHGGLRRLREAPRSIPAMPLHIALRDRRVLITVSSFILINVVAVFGLGVPSGYGGIAWEAHIGGFLAGFLLFGLFDIAARADSADHLDLG